MKLVADLHVHTVASGHAYSTVLENAQAAGEKGLELIAITDHGPAMPGGPHSFYFGNLRILPKTIFGVRVLQGIEANIMDTQGNIDLTERYLKHLDIVLAGFHGDSFNSMSVEENTRAMVNTIAGGKVDIIVHPGNPAFKIDLEVVAQAAVEHNVLLEINNVSLLEQGRKGSRENCEILAATVAQLGGKVSLGSDAHYAGLVGDLAEAEALARAAGLTPDQVINTSVDALTKFLHSRGHRDYSPSVPRSKLL